MLTHDWKPLLEDTLAHVQRFLEGLPDRPVTPTATAAELIATLGGSLPEAPSDPRATIELMASVSDSALTVTASGRFFGFVIGGSLPAALAADILAVAWDQNAGLFAASPAASTIEEVARRWLVELLGLPADASAGFVTGGQAANFTGLAAARHHVLAAAGWDVENDGLVGAPPVTVLVGGERHVTIDRALRLLGLGAKTARVVEADEQGRMRPGALREALARADGPTIVCAQVGNVNTGAIDPVGEISDIAHESGAWVHVDGAFGLWAAAAPSRRDMVAGMDRADSWATDAHKWLNVPYDSGLVFCAHPGSHLGAMGVTASYLVQGTEEERDPLNWTPEFSRRARGFAVWAALRSLGREGVEEMIERGCELARSFARRLEAVDGVEVLNEVVLNQVLVRFDDDDEITRRVIAAVQRDGTCWLGGSMWRGRQVMRVSVSNWSTTEDDVELSVDAVLRCFASVR